MQRLSTGYVFIGILAGLVALSCGRQMVEEAAAPAARRAPAIRGALPG